MGDACDMAYETVFLAFDEARYITGDQLMVDGEVPCKYA
jgi:NAD(P)-dependent dehydrogenase (short-subunit alcohol dehydrogenase family)